MNVREVAEHDIRNCNSCLAGNYKSVEKLYSLDIGQMSICLCYDCLRELSANIEGFLTEKGGEEEWA